MILRTELSRESGARVEHLGRAKSYIAGGFALLAFVFALAAGTASAPALGGLSWLMVTSGAAGVVYVGGAVIVAAFSDPQARTQQGLRPAEVIHRGDTRRSTAR